jgi:predicted dehydrogenase
LKVLLIGYGSIGKRHYEVLSELDSITHIDVVTAQTLSGIRTYRTLNQITDLDDYNYIVIASETFKHFEQIEYLEKNTKNKVILCEKPLFDTARTIVVKNNSIFVGYVLRFHPILQKIRLVLTEEKILVAQIRCGSYLPSWRPGTDYRKSYSASKEQGGGVLLDLSHEIDYMQWLFGSVKTISAYQSKISTLKIDSDDIVMATGKTDKQVAFAISLDYISKIPMREITIHTIDKTIQADLISNSLRVTSEESGTETVEIESFARNDLFRKMHLSALGNKESLCTLEEGLNVMKTISTIQDQNNG